VLAIAGGVVWFQPQKMVISDRVDEAIPSAAGTSRGRAATREPVILAAGSFPVARPCDLWQGERTV
jgi:hypothetical protein